MPSRYKNRIPRRRTPPGEPVSAGPHRRYGCPRAIIHQGFLLIERFIRQGHEITAHRHIPGRKAECRGWRPRAATGRYSTPADYNPTPTGWPHRCREPIPSGTVLASPTSAVRARASIAGLCAASMGVFPPRESQGISAIPSHNSTTCFIVSSCPFRKRFPCVFKGIEGDGCLFSPGP